MKKFRGTWLDPFGYNKERVQERALISQYNQDIETILQSYKEVPYELLVEFAELPIQVKGFGAIKLASIKRMNDSRDLVLRQFSSDKRRTESSVLEVAE